MKMNCETKMNTSCAFFISDLIQAQLPPIQIRNVKIRHAANALSAFPIRITLWMLTERCLFEVCWQSCQTKTKFNHKKKTVVDIAFHQLVFSKPASVFIVQFVHSLPVDICISVFLSVCIFPFESTSFDQNGYDKEGNWNQIELHFYGWWSS